MLASFMSFLASDTRNSPEHITALNTDLLDRISRLVRGVKTSAEEDLGDEALI